MLELDLIRSQFLTVIQVLFKNNPHHYPQSWPPHFLEQDNNQFRSLGHIW